MRPSELAYYKNPRDCQPSGSIPLDPNCWTEPSPGQSKDKVHRFVLVTGERNFELAASDHKYVVIYNSFMYVTPQFINTCMFCRTRLQWISALQQAIGLSSCEQSHQRVQAAKRRKQRELESASQNEEMKRRKSQVLDIELARAQLEAEKTVRSSVQISFNIESLDFLVYY